jgi:hypothetical protein
MISIARGENPLENNKNIHLYEQMLFKNVGGLRSGITYSEAGSIKEYENIWIESILYTTLTVR